MSTALLLAYRLGHLAASLRPATRLAAGRQLVAKGDNAVLKGDDGRPLRTHGREPVVPRLFMGFGWSLSVVMLMQTILLWQLASLARTDPAPLRPMIAVIALSTIASGVIAWRLHLSSAGAVLRRAALALWARVRRRPLRLSRRHDRHH